MGQFGVGQSVRRTEDKRLITGAGRYTDDIDLVRQAHAFVLRSPHAHAKILRIDTGAAAEAPGVLGVFTAADLEKDDIGTIPCIVPLTNKDNTPLKSPPRHALARDRVRHVGDSVALVVAETLEQAKDAAELVKVEYEVLPSVTDMNAALSSSTLVWDEAPRNLCLDWESGDKAATEAGLAQAAHKVALTVVNNRVVVASMEPRGAVGDWDKAEERFVLYASTQGSHFLRKILASNVFKLPENKFRVVTPDVGGGFGMKLFVYPEHVLVLWAARKLRRPVKWRGERSDAFLTDTHGRDNLTTATLGLDKDGKFTALKIETVANLGAYLSNYAPFIPTLAGTGMLAGVYSTPAVHVDVKCTFTHTVPVDAYRGAGRPEAAYVLERLVDHAARKLGISPAEIRRRNFIRPEQMPFTTALGLTYDSGDFAKNMDDALKAVEAAGLGARKAEAKKRGKLRGLGIATYIEQCGGGFDEMAETRFDPSGTATVLVGSQASGQGHQTAYAQIVADRLGLPFDQIRVHQGDSDAVGFGRGTGGSRSLPVGGVAVERAAARIIEKARKIAAHRLEAAEADLEFKDGEFRIAGTDRAVSIEQVAKDAFNPLVLPQGLEQGLDEKAHFMPSASTFPNGCHACEVEIDPDTGVTEIVRFVVVDDFGTVVNPMMLAGQVHGGVGQGVGQALLESVIYEEGSGQLVTGSFMDYAMPRADDLGDIEFSYNVVPCTTNPMGVKGAGEAGAIGAPPAVINAIVDALAELGVEHVDMPATPRRVWQIVQEHRAA